DRAVEVALLGHHRELRARPDRIAYDVDAADASRPRRRPDSGRQHPDGRGLPRSVGAEQTEHLTRCRRAGDAVNGVHRRLRIPLDEVAHLDCQAFGLRWDHLEILGRGVYVRAMDVVSNRAVEGRKTVTVLFCDLVAYTELAGRLDPEALRHLMLLFFERAAAVIEGHRGTVEKFVGDEVMAGS